MKTKLVVLDQDEITKINFYTLMKQKQNKQNIQQLLKLLQIEIERERRDFENINF